MAFNFQTRLVNMTAYNNDNNNNGYFLLDIYDILYNTLINLT